MLIMSFVFLGLIAGIVIGIGLMMWYMKSVVDGYEQQMTDLKAGYERQRESRDTYINKLVAKNKELENRA